MAGNGKIARNVNTAEGVRVGISCKKAKERGEAVEPVTFFQF
jgi:hypothetical protein